MAPPGKRILGNAPTRECREMTSDNARRSRSENPAGFRGRLTSIREVAMVLQRQNSGISASAAGDPPPAMLYCRIT